MRTIDTLDTANRAPLVERPVRHRMAGVALTALGACGMALAIAVLVAATPADAWSNRAVPFAIAVGTAGVLSLATGEWLRARLRRQAFARPSAQPGAPAQQSGERTAFPS